MPACCRVDHEATAFQEPRSLSYAGHAAYCFIGSCVNVVVDLVEGADAVSQVLGCPGLSLISALVPSSTSRTNL